MDPSFQIGAVSWSRELHSTILDWNQIVLWHYPMEPTGEEFTTPLKSVPEASTWCWKDEYHGACFIKGKKRIASWTWRAGELPQGLCLPPEYSNLAEWRYNLAGRIKGTGAHNYNEVIAHKECMFTGGFLTFGTFRSCSEELISEQQTKDILAVNRVVFAALPDDRTVIVMQQASSVNRSYLSSIQGLLLHIPNDLFNDNMRTYYYNNKKQDFQGFGSLEELVDTKSSWINVDDLISVASVYGEDSLKLHRPGRRQIGLRNKIYEDTLGMLYADEICCPFYKGLKDVKPNTMIYDTGFILQSNVDHQFTKEYMADNCCSQLKIKEDLPGIRVIMAGGADNNDYILVSNMGENTECISLTLPRIEAIEDLVTKETFESKDEEFTLIIEGNSARLFVVSSFLTK